jgi:hypothetical protein
MIQLISSSSSALQPWVGLGLQLRFPNNTFLRGVFVSLTPNPQPGGPSADTLPFKKSVIPLADVLPNFFARMPILAEKNNHISSHHGSRNCSVQMMGMQN